MSFTPYVPRRTGTEEWNRHAIRSRGLAAERRGDPGTRQDTGLVSFNCATLWLHSPATVNGPLYDDSRCQIRRVPVKDKRIDGMSIMHHEPHWGSEWCTLIQSFLCEDAREKSGVPNGAAGVFPVDDVRRVHHFRVQGFLNFGRRQIAVGESHADRSLSWGVISQTPVAVHRDDEQIFGESGPEDVCSIDTTGTEGAHGYAGRERDCDKPFSVYAAVAA